MMLFTPLRHSLQQLVRLLDYQVWPLQTENTHFNLQSERQTAVQQFLYYLSQNVQVRVCDYARHLYDLILLNVQTCHLKHRHTHTHTHTK